MKLYKTFRGWQPVNCLDDGEHYPTPKFTRPWEQRFQTTFWYQCEWCGFETSQNDSHRRFSDYVNNMEKEANNWAKTKRTHL